ncbi:hypothetical protein CHK_0017 [Christensenella hongkongensis]|uniref:Uncharacterized protein n=1 Tax=Christensenella hongkongensis TaxID=270498 RepID=A0A0M2NK05_9FIRM|nr:hypothetical protein CHK_0017 [Christensenella hongkongensis]
MYMITAFNVSGDEAVTHIVSPDNVEAHTGVLVVLVNATSTLLYFVPMKGTA